MQGGGEVLVLRFDEEKTEWVKSSAATGVPAEFKAQVRGKEGERKRLPKGAGGREGAAEERRAIESFFR